MKTVKVERYVQTHINAHVWKENVFSSRSTRWNPARSAIMTEEDSSHGRRIDRRLFHGAISRYIIWDLQPEKRMRKKRKFSPKLPSWIEAKEFLSSMIIEVVSPRRSFSSLSFRMDYK